MNEAVHVSVLLRECIENLNIRPDGIYLDGTLGLGGHSFEIASRLTSGRLIGIDRDETAIARAGRRLAPFAERVTLVHGNFSDACDILDELGIEGVDGMLFDLGVSSPQLDEAERGFSYMHDAPLDMRMDGSAALTAYEVVNSWPEERLNRIFWDYGEERYARRITAAIARAREQKPIETTMELVALIKSALPAQALREKQHPAKRSFQAIRIAVNDELNEVERMIATAPDKLNPAALRNQLSFAGGSDREIRDRSEGERLHLPAGSARVHLRLCQDAAQREPQADPAERRGNREKSPRPQREAPRGGEGVRA